MSKKDDLTAAIKKEMVRLIRKEELEFTVKGEIYVVPKEHVNLLLESQSLNVLNLLSPKDGNLNGLEDEYLEKCVATSFGGNVNILEFKRALTEADRVKYHALAVVRGGQGLETFAI